MKRYDVIVVATAVRALQRMQTIDRERCERAITGLAVEPRPPGAIKLTGREEWRVRVGDFRILYQIENERLIVTVADVAKRDDVYR